MPSFFNYSILSLKGLSLLSLSLNLWIFCEYSDSWKLPWWTLLFLSLLAYGLFTLLCYFFSAIGFEYS